MHSIRIMIRYVKRSLRRFKRACESFCNRLWSMIIPLLPLDKRMIAFESEGDLCDNAFALYDYMLKNHYFDYYRAVWLVDKPENYSPANNTYYIKKWGKNDDILRLYSLYRCKYYFYDHNNLINTIRAKKGKKTVFLGHGCGYKGPKGIRNKCDMPPDLMLVTGDHYIKPMSYWFGVPEERIISLGYPRLDYFFYDNSLVLKDFLRDYHLEEYMKIIIWMPTFRQSTNRSLSEDYLVNETGLPLIQRKRDLFDFNEFLKENQSICILKIHHLQADLEIFKNHYSNILILKDDILRRYSIQLNQLMAATDTLITDYSTVSNDYLLLNKPLVYTLDDYDDYSKNRGMYPIDLKSTMKGHHVYNVKELFGALKEIIDGNDVYANERRDWTRICHKYDDGFASKRVLDYLGIRKKNRV